MIEFDTIDLSQFERIAENPVIVTDLDMETLVTVAKRMQDLSQLISKVRGIVETEVMSRMHRDGASIMAAAGITCELSASNSYVYTDPTGLHRAVKALLGVYVADAVARYVPPDPTPPKGKWKVNTNKLRSIIGKLSTEQAADLEKHFRIERKDERVIFRAAAAPSTLDDLPFD